MPPAGIRNGPEISKIAPFAMPGAIAARCDVTYSRVCVGLKTTPQSSEPSCSTPVNRRNGETKRSGEISPTSRLPPSSQTSTSPAALTVTLSTASSDAAGASAQS